MRYIFINTIFILLFLDIAFAKNDYQALMPAIFSYDHREANNEYAVIIEKQNMEKLKYINSAFPGVSKRKIPVIEFKAINPTKYRIRVHGATDDFLLILGQSYHKNWRAFIGSIWKNTPQIEKEENLNNLNKSKYFIFEGNKDDQAEKNELQAYVEKGWISALGDLNSHQKTYLYNNGNKIIYEKSNTYYIDYVSKKIKNSIQNNNLYDGTSFETLFLKNSTSAIPDEYHWQANGFANSWWIQLERVKNTEMFIQNSDGSIDFEVILKFYPEHILNIGIFISSASFFISLGIFAKRKISMFFK
jgi:hypothetical protein